MFEIVLNISAIIIGLVICIIALIIMIRILHYIHFNRIQRDDKVVFIHSMNIYILLFIFMLIINSFTMQSLLGDHYGLEFDSQWCIFIGFIDPVVFGTLYWNFVNQAFYRFCRIIYFSRSSFQSSWLYFMLLPIELLLVAILLSPSLIWRDITYLPREHYCYISVMNVRGAVWIFSFAFGLPLSCLLMIYLRITLYLQHNTQNQRVLMVRQREQRDLTIIRRICVIVSLLMMLGVPALTILLISYIQNVENPYFFRVEWFFVSLSMFGIDFALIIFTPQLKSIFFKRYQQQVLPVILQTAMEAIPKR
ncbi:unnamed protein product [Adineta ricciae]|nr:unnamed protein product [Adineta ricciae]